MVMTDTLDGAQIEPLGLGRVLEDLRDAGRGIRAKMLYVSAGSSAFGQTGPTAVESDDVHVRAPPTVSDIDHCWGSSKIGDQRLRSADLERRGAESSGNAKRIIPSTVPI
jgi:hypothetical protein